MSSKIILSQKKLQDKTTPSVWCGEALPFLKTSTMANSDTQQQTFYQYLKGELTVTNFNSLPQIMGWTKRKTTMRLQQPSQMPLSMLERLRELLSDDFRTLVHQYELGYDGCTAREHKNFMASLNHVTNE